MKRNRYESVINTQCCMREGKGILMFGSRKTMFYLFIYLFIYFASSLQGTSESYDFGQRFVFIWPKVVYSFLMAKSVVIIRTNINGTL